MSRGGFLWSRRDAGGSVNRGPPQSDRRGGRCAGDWRFFCSRHGGNCWRWHRRIHCLRRGGIASRGPGRLAGCRRGIHWAWRRLSLSASRRRIDGAVGRWRTARGHSGCRAGQCARSGDLWPRGAAGLVLFRHSPGLPASHRGRFLCLSFRRLCVSAEHGRSRAVPARGSDGNRLPITAFNLFDWIDGRLSVRVGNLRGLPVAKLFPRVLAPVGLGERLGRQGVVA